MKKILLSTVACAVFSTSALAATTGQTYVKGGLGYSFGSSLKDLTKDGVTTGTNNSDSTTINSDRKLGSFAGGLGLGYQLNNNFGLEFMMDYAPQKASMKRNGIESGTTENLEFVKDGTNQYVFTADLVNGIAANNIKNTAKENSLGFGLKAAAQHSLGNDVSIVGGFGAGLSMKSLEKGIEGTLEKGTKKEKFNVTAKSKSITQPFLVASAGVDYAINETVSAGLEYNFKLNLGSKSYKAKADVKKKVITNGTGSNDFTVEESTVAAESVLAKDNVIGKASKYAHQIMATVKFGF